jgi:hypothetical protein
VRIEKVDFTFSPSSWHLRTEEQAEIDRAWTSIRTGEQTQEVLAYLASEKVSQRLSCRIRFHDSALD